MGALPRLRAQGTVERPLHSQKAVLLTVHIYCIRSTLKTCPTPRWQWAPKIIPPKGPSRRMRADAAQEETKRFNINIENAWISKTTTD